MALPAMGLCPDTKRGLNLCILKKNPNSTMLSKGSYEVFSTTTSCPSDSVNYKQPKFSSYLPSPSFHTKTFDSYLVGGSLGSKSQGRSTRNVFVYEFIFKVATEWCNFNPVTSPPKKKFANSADTVDLPSVVEKQCPQESQIEGPKQSYAEVAKVAVSLPRRSENCRTVQDLAGTGSRKDSHCRRPGSTGPKSSRRKSSRRGRKDSTSSQKSDTSCLDSSMLEPQPEALKDLRLSQQEKHFSQLKIAANRNCWKADRHSDISSKPDKRAHIQSEHTESQTRPKRRSNFRSHCDIKRGTRAKNFNCDIDKINWRTGEPIGGNMGLCDDYADDVVGKDFADNQSFNSSLISEQSIAESTGEPKMPESPPDITSSHDVPNGSPRFRRRSLSSECSVDSEDSFIVFQSGAPSDSSSDVTSDWSDCDSDDSFESDEEASEEDICDGSFLSSQRLREVNDLWHTEYAPKPDSSIINNKKVRFSNSKPTVHKMLTWDFAYRSCRPGPWEQMGRDRDRFRTRIRQSEVLISPVLTSAHRNKIWNRLQQLPVPSQ